MITEMIAITIIPTIVIVANTAVSIPSPSAGVSVSIKSVGRGILDDAMTGDDVVDDAVVVVCVIPALCVSVDEDEDVTVDEDVTAMIEVCITWCDEMIPLWGLIVVHSSTCWSLPLT